MDFVIRSLFLSFFFFDGWGVRRLTFAVNGERGRNQIY